MQGWLRALAPGVPLAATLAVALACMVTAAWAHPSPRSELLLAVQDDSIRAELTLPLEELQLAFGAPLLDSATGRVLASDAAVATYLVAHIRPVAPDGRPWVVKVQALRWMLAQRPADVVATVVLRPPGGAPLGTLVLDMDAIGHHVQSHVTVVALRQPGGDGPRLLGTLRFGQRNLAISDAEGRWWRGMPDLFTLGMRHIGGGADHLLFLLTLLLPAPLLAVQGRWAGHADTRQVAARLLAIVTAFTAGHCVTLVLGAVGAIVLPARPVEVAIALSILVSAVHAWRPLFPRREWCVAAGFGLVHGLAFAAGIRELGLHGGRLAAGILAFNLGIEAVQAVVVLVAMPPIVLLARRMPWARPVAAALSGIVALAWMVQRACDGLLA